MTKADFLEMMHFPQEWMSLGMYPDDLFHWQLAGYKPGHEQGAEHDRNGAFHWWFRKPPSKTELKNLVQLAALDPDPQLGQDLRQYVRRATAFDTDVEALDRKLFAAHRLE